MGEYVSRLGVALGSSKTQGGIAGEAASEVRVKAPRKRPPAKFPGGSALAREVGLSHPAVSLKLKAGMTPDEIREQAGKRRLDRELADKALAPGASAADVARWRGADPSPHLPEVTDAVSIVQDLESKHSAERRKEVALANERELDVAKKKGELIPRLQVAQYVSGVLTAARDELLRIGQEKQDDLAGETNPGKCRVIVENAVRHALAKLEAMQHHTYA